MSSARISTLVRRSPIVGLPAPLLQLTADHDSCAPLVRPRAAFSASSRQQTTSKNEVDSSHSFVSRFCHRRLTARVSGPWWPDHLSCTQFPDRGSDCRQR